jgi:hypothetical protein
MDDSSWVKPAVIGATVGATVGVLLFGLIGFTVGGWMTTGGCGQDVPGSGARDHDRSDGSCLPRPVHQRSGNRATKLAVIRDTPIEGRREAIMTSGWATVPGSEQPSHDLAQACMNALEIQPSE